MFNDESSENKIGIFFTVITALGLLAVLIFGLINQGVTTDEFFSLILTSTSWSSLFEVGMSDVHPLLYYLILKSSIELCSLFGFTNAIQIGIIVSMIPLFLILLLTITHIKNNFGWLTAGIFALGVILLPRMLVYAIEIRMYSWALLFITASFLCFYEIIKNPSWKSWVILTLLTICSANTHYFSALASFTIYLVMLGYLVFKNRKLIKYWIISSIFSIIGFLPWLSICLSQISNTFSSYWIPDITIGTVIKYYFFLLSPLHFSYVNNDLIVNFNFNQIIEIIIGILLFVLIMAVIIKYLKDRTSLTPIKREDYDFALYGLLISILVPLIGIAVSLTFQPIIFYRYLIPLMGIIWLSISLLVTKYKSNKKLFISFIFILIITIGSGFNIFMGEDGNSAVGVFSDPTVYDGNNLNSIIENNSIIMIEGSNLKFYVDTFYLTENYTYLTWNDNFSTQVETAIKDPGINYKINSGCNIYLITPNSEYCDDLIKKGFNVTNINYISNDSYLNNNIYKLNI